MRLPFRRRAASEDDVVQRSDLYDTQIADFWANLASTTGASNPTLIERVWVVNRVIQMTANACSSMPLRFYGRSEPAWVTNPDPAWYPNGIADAVFAIVWSMCGWGDAFLYVTSRYADGYPSNWTVLDPAPVSVETVRGQRCYRSGNKPLDERNMVQISRDPRPGGNRGTSVIKSYSAYSNGLLAAADLGNVMMGSGGIPNAVLKSQRKLDAEQAAALQEAWVTRTSLRRGAPAVLPPEIDFQTLSFSPADLMLLDAQKFDAQVLATCLGIPAQLVNLSLEGGLNYQTPVLALEQWWRTDLRPTCVHIAAALSGNMLPRGAAVKFDSSDFLAPDWKDLATVWIALVEKGVASVEEARAALFGVRAEPAENPIEKFLTPPSAGASPAQQPSSVVALRPTQAVSE